MSTEFANTDTIERKWVLIDAKDVVLGRLASKVAPILMGKNKTNWAPNQDVGDNVIIINAEKVALTGKKRDTMRYFNHSTHPGGWRELSVTQAQAINPGYPVWHAIKRMIPKTILGDHMLKKLHIYGGESHPHAAQKPVALAVK
ncbi:MAG TPA: 50S ribosomal protein L13 [Fibrobacteria bacterium]|nr:50S ribosomal protein L13 [Fibrobacteria bacterium]